MVFTPRIKAYFMVFLNSDFSENPSKAKWHCGAAEILYSAHAITNDWIHYMPVGTVRI
jgi:hypothetical protein